MEAKLKKELGTSVLKSTGHSGGGCISEGQSYDTDFGRVFVKINHKSEVTGPLAGPKLHFYLHLLKTQLAMTYFAAVIAVEFLFCECCLGQINVRWRNGQLGSNFKD